MKHELSKNVPIKLLLLFTIPSMIEIYLTSTIPIKLLFLSSIFFFNSLLLSRQWASVNSHHIFFFFTFSPCFFANIFKFQFFLFLIIIQPHENSTWKYSHLSTGCSKSNNFLAIVNYSCRANINSKLLSLLGKNWFKR